MTILETFAARLHAAPEPDTAAAIAERLQVHLADTKAAMRAGAASAEGRQIAARAAAAGPALFGDGLTDRIAIQVAQTRLTEIDDIHMASCTTVGSVIVPVTLELAAACSSNETQVAAAIRAGYDAMVRLGSAVDGARILYKGIWPTYLVAPFGAAAAASVLLRLDAARTADALALALAQISGAAGGPAGGRNPRWLLAGLAAACGLRAALAANEGYGGDRTLFDADWFAKTHGLAFDATKLEGAPGASLLEMSIKPWCTAKQACAALAGFVELLDGGILADNIKAVRVHVPPAYRGMIAHRPPGRIGRIVSIAWQCGLAAYHRDELFDIERAEHVNEPAFAALLEKVAVLESPSLAGHFPAHYPARVEIEMNDGTTRETTVIDAPGDPARAFSADDVARKAQLTCRA